LTVWAVNYLWKHWHYSKFLAQHIKPSRSCFSNYFCGESHKANWHSMVKDV